MSEKLKVGILGGTGMVGQRFISNAGSCKEYCSNECK